MKKILHNIRQHLNDIALITLIAVIGLMLGVTYQHCLVVKDISELERKIDAIIENEGDIACKVSIIGKDFYYVCDEQILNEVKI